MNPTTARSFRWIALLLPLLGGPLAAAAPPGAPTLCWRGADGACIPAASLALEVDFRVNGLIAEGRVIQRFRNDGASFLEGSYVLPLAEGAAVHTLVLTIGQRRIEGEIREREQARAEYRAAAAAGRRTSLVEQQQANLFRTAVANVAPGESVEVEIGFWQPVAFHDGRFELVFPLTVVPRYALDAGDAEAPPTLAAAAAAPAPMAVRLEVALEPGLPLAALESRSHAVRVEPRGEGFRVRLDADAVPADRDFVLAWRPERGSVPHAALFVEHAPDADYAMVMMLADEVAAERLPRELILVIDTSGSMHGGAIGQARAALDAALARLAPQDRFNVIRFSTGTEPLFERPVAAEAQAVRVAREWVSLLEADGGTEMHPALEAALAGAPPQGYVRQVVFATDGAVTGEESLYTLIEQRGGAARLFPVGIGDAPNARFLEQAARLGRGAGVVIRDLGEVAERMHELYAKLDRPALRDVQLSWPGIADAYPQRIPDLYQGEPLVVVARLARGDGQVDAVGWRKDAVWSKSLPLTRRRSDAGVARLWARRRIDALEDELRRGADAAVTRAAIVDLALTHRLVTRYTSLVAVDRTPVRPQGAPLEGVEFANGARDGLAFAQGGTASRLAAWAGLAGLLLALGAASAGRWRWARGRAASIGGRR